MPDLGNVWLGNNSALNYIEERNRTSVPSMLARMGGLYKVVAGGGQHVEVEGDVKEDDQQGLFEL